METGSSRPYFDKELPGFKRYDVPSEEKKYALISVASTLLGAASVYIVAEAARSGQLEDATLWSIGTLANVAMAIGFGKMARDGFIASKIREKAHQESEVINSFKCTLSDTEKESAIDIAFRDKA